MVFTGQAQNLKRVKITRIIDTNLFEIDDRDTVTLANLEIPSKTTADTLLKEYFIPNVWKYEIKHILTKYFYLEYAQEKNKSSGIRKVYLYEKQLFSQNLINEYMLKRGYAQYVPLKDSPQQKKCEEAALMAKKENIGIWKTDKYFRKGTGIKEAAIEFGLGRRAGIDNTYKFIELSLRTEQNSPYFYNIAYQQLFYKDLHYYEDTPKAPDIVNASDIFIKLAVGGNHKYLGIKAALYLIYINHDNVGEGFYFPILPSVGINAGLIKRCYISAEWISISQGRQYLAALSAHYYPELYIKSINLLYYWNNSNDNDQWEIKLNANYIAFKKMSLNFDIAVVQIKNYDEIKKYLAGSIGIGYLFR